MSTISAKRCELKAVDDGLSLTVVFNNNELEDLLTRVRLANPNVNEPPEACDDDGSPGTMITP